MLSTFRKHLLALEIDQARHHQMMREMIQHLVGAVFGALLVWFIFRNESSLAAQWQWLYVNCGLLAFTSITYALYYLKNSIFSVAGWGWYSCLMMLVWGAGWGFVPYAFLQTEDPVYIVTLIGIVIGLCTSPSITIALYPLAYLGFISPVLFSLSWHLNQLDFGQNLIIRLLPGIFWLFLLGYAFNLHQLLIRSIRLQLEKAGALDDAELANIAKSKFLASASHDLRQPLQAVNLFSSALENELKSPSNQQLFDNLQASVNSMSDLLNSLLDISKLDAQAMDVNKRDIALQPLLDKLRDAYALQAQDKALHFAYTPVDLVVQTDTILLERIVCNLLSNALRYTEQGSVALSVVREGDRVLITISDTGGGIAEVDQKLIFEEFHQLENPERDKEKGLGLGLAIVQRLCELLGHQVTLSSALGVGSQFTICLPLGNADRLETPAEQSSGRWDISQLSILVLDDEKSIRLGLHALMSQWGCDVQCCESADEALALIDNWTPKLIISDYRLRQHKTGSEAIAQIWAKLGENIPAILITGDTDPERIKEARNSGHTLLHKPVKPAQLRTAIHRLSRH